MRPLWSDSGLEKSGLPTPMKTSTSDAPKLRPLKVTLDSLE